MQYNYIISYNHVQSYIMHTCNHIHSYDIRTSTEYRYAMWQGADESPASIPRSATAGKLMSTLDRSSGRTFSAGLASGFHHGVTMGFIMVTLWLCPQFINLLLNMAHRNSWLMLIDVLL